MIYAQDCLITMQNIKPESVDLVVTSPPYDQLRTYKGFDFDFEAIATQLTLILKPGGVIVWIVNDGTVKGSKTGSSFRQALGFMDNGLRLHDTMIWEKPNYAPLYPGVKRYDSNFEFMFVFSKGTPKTFNAIKDKPKSESSKQRLKYGITYIQKDGSRTEAKQADNLQEFSKRTAIWKIPNGQKRGIGHPAVFPEALARDHIETWSNEGDLVYDPFMGSGTTAIACVDLNRRWLGSEISQEYVNLANNRLGLIKGEQK